jgi:hypothetical protein
MIAHENRKERPCSYLYVTFEVDIQLFIIRKEGNLDELNVNPTKYLDCIFQFLIMIFCSSLGFNTAKGANTRKHEQIMLAQGS